STDAIGRAARRVSIQRSMSAHGRRMAVAPSESSALKREMSMGWSALSSCLSCLHHPGLNTLTTDLSIGFDSMFLDGGTSCPHNVTRVTGLPSRGPPKNFYRFTDRQAGAGQEKSATKTLVFDRGWVHT